MGWVVNPYRKEQGENAKEAGWVPRPVWTGAKNLAVTGFDPPDSLIYSELLYRLGYPGPQNMPVHY